MSWAIEYLKEATRDLLKSDNSQRLYVLKAIEKVSENPLPNTEGGYGNPLGNLTNSKLAGYLKIKLLKSGLRVVYTIERDNEIMRIIIISIRDDNTVYMHAEKRIK